MKNLFKTHYGIIVLGFWLTVLTCLTSCASGSGYGACAAYACVDVEVCEQ